VETDFAQNLLCTQLAVKWERPCGNERTYRRESTAAEVAELFTEDESLQL